MSEPPDSEMDDSELFVEFDRVELSLGRVGGGAGFEVRTSSSISSAGVGVGEEDRDEDADEDLDFGSSSTAAAEWDFWRRDGGLGRQLSKLAAVLWRRGMMMWGFASADVTVCVDDDEAVGDGRWWLGC